MRNILSLATIFFLVTLPAFSIEEQPVSFIGKLAAINNVLKQEDRDKLETLLKDKTISADVSNYAFCSNDRWFLLSKNADKLAQQLISKDKLKTGAFFQVKGYLHGNVIDVKQICDVSIQQF